MGTPARHGDLVDELFTLRDWLRYAVSAFTKAKLSYGHGTDNANDEAAFLLLTSLNLPIDQLEPWLDCRLTRNERTTVEALIRQRIETRKPAPFLVNCAWIQGRRFTVDERVIVPRSYIGEMLCRDSLSSLVPDPAAVTRVLELCTGSGCLAILAAEAFPNALIDATDISANALEVAKQNVSEYELSDRITLVRADLFEGLKSDDYDLIIANPPYVTRAAVEAFPLEYKAEPQIAHLGGDDGLDVVRRIIERAQEFLAPDGSLIVEVGHAGPSLESAYPDLPFLWLDSDESEGEVFSLSARDFAALPKAKRPKSR